jgi:hypothetical protein
MPFSTEEPLSRQVHGAVVLIEIAQRGSQRTMILNRDGNGAGLDVLVVVESAPGDDDQLRHETPPLSSNRYSTAEVR